MQVVGKAKNGEMAVQMAEDLNPDIILMDLIMPKKTGIEACRVQKPHPNIFEVQISNYLRYQSTLKQKIRRDKNLFRIF